MKPAARDCTCGRDNGNLFAIVGNNYRIIIPHNNPENIHFCCDIPLGFCWGEVGMVIFINVSYYKSGWTRGINLMVKKNNHTCKCAVLDLVSNTASCQCQPALLPRHRSKQ
jgi:hypothetical protein